VTKLETLYSEYLKNNPQVEEYKYHFIPIMYLEEEGFVAYKVSFWVKYKDGRTEWIEAKAKMPPLRKYLVAAAAAKNAKIVFRGLTKEEIQVLDVL
jgi:hypothetical protein